MQIHDFDYDYPLDLIAQAPLAERDAARMLVLDRHTGRCTHSVTQQLAEHIQPGDVLVINDTKVLPMRLVGTRDTGGRTELLLLHRIEQSQQWVALATKLKRLRPGMTLAFANHISAEVIERRDDHIVIEFPEQIDVESMLIDIGQPPLPPYIARDVAPEDRDRYQTIYATTAGSAAAPTAGFHFSEKLMQACLDCGAIIAPVTLHVGIDTFQPLRSENIMHHRMHGEYFHVPDTTLEAIRKAKTAGNRIIAVGTTSVRALESAAILGTSTGTTTLFIYPGYEFQLVDSLLTNFHQPRTSLILLVSALAGRKHLLEAYREAIAQRYRLFSYGDAMLIT